MNQQMKSKPQIETHLHNEYRTCPLSMNKVIRSDLFLTLKNIIDQKLRETTIKTSDYVANINEVVYVMTITFKSHCFAIENKEIVFGQTECFKIAEILPKDFTDDNVDVLTLTPALPLNLMNPPFADELANHFEEGHLSLTHSYFFGALGSKQASLNKHPIQNLVFKSLRPFGVVRRAYEASGLSSI
ncbi:hypothetical protein BCV72DRAFT_241205 [Rhizopus microsporus var. microsporus]|uniref:Uncharacterized protein n=2 Tax=Rhizopus microsporus TaxID=58291 RepID=A0A2G4SFD4_RHIZD|nr:uncharacterized protein RHIMIDRAFT_249220 [Rhizopus microsporus ATCC 52813]ORE07474.1 hypothetical protein BCV72DRAFT_241205 [Rhizopus microsporus var. microsporus]PHZ07485.1 hypothetical protein RHIMIDRAFT_249220 [Rhizopus microsporus ATCC 52813]